MAKVALFIGRGFIPTDADARDAVETGLVKNFDKIFMTIGSSTLDRDLAFGIYINALRKNGWEDPGGLLACELKTADGRQIWAVYPQEHEISTEKTIPKYDYEISKGDEAFERMLADLELGHPNRGTTIISLAFAAKMELDSLRTLGTAGSKPNLPIIVDSLLRALSRDSDHNIRATVIKELGKIAHEITKHDLILFQKIPTLVEGNLISSLEDENEKVRNAATKALQKIGTPSALAALPTQKGFLARIWERQKPKMTPKVDSTEKASGISYELPAVPEKKTHSDVLIAQTKSLPSPAEKTKEQLPHTEAITLPRSLSTRELELGSPSRSGGKTGEVMLFLSQDKKRLSFVLKQSLSRSELNDLRKAVEKGLVELKHRIFLMSNYPVIAVDVTIASQAAAPFKLTAYPKLGSQQEAEILKRIATGGRFIVCFYFFDIDDVLMLKTGVEMIFPSSQVLEEDILKAEKHLDSLPPGTRSFQYAVDQVLKESAEKREAPKPVTFEQPPSNKPTATPETGPVEVVVDKISLDQASKRYIVNLKDQRHNRMLQIVTGESQAQAIALHMENIKPPAPLPYDLGIAFMNYVNARILKVLVNDLRNTVFYAAIFLEHNSQTIEIDASPTDAIALALRAKAPIFVSEEVMKKMAIPIQ